MRYFCALAVLSVLCSPLLAHAQERTARQHIRGGLAHAAAGDTAAALVELQKAVDAAPKLAEAHYQLGRLLARHATRIETEPRERMQAEKALRKALSLDPDNVVYLAELGMLSLKQRLRSDGERLLKRALRKVEEEGVADSLLLADIFFNLGSTNDLRYEQFRDRRILGPLQEPVAVDVPIEAEPYMSRYIEGFLERASPIEDSGREYWELAVDHYRTALLFNPRHFEAARRLLLFMLDDRQYDEYQSLVRRMQQLHPDRPEVGLYLGLGLHAAGREEEAGAAFEQAFAALPDEKRAPFFDVQPLLRPRTAETYERWNDSERAEFDTLYWRLSDPLYLTEVNERRLEHFARAAYVDLRFSAPETGLRGWQTDRGLIYLRYGPPDEVAVVPAIAAKLRRVWYYDEGFSFIFDQNQSYIHSWFAGEFKWFARELSHARPTSYANIPSIPILMPMPMQLARFRGYTPQQAAVEVHCELPLEMLSRGMDLETGEFKSGIFLRNVKGQEIKRQVKTQILKYTDAPHTNGYRSWRVLLPAEGRITFAVETRDEVSWRAAVARDTLRSTFFPEDSLSLSDILLADNILPLAKEPKRRSEFDIWPNPAREYARDQRLFMYYEIYGLEPDDEGFGSYDASLRVTIKALNREGTIFGDTLLGGGNPLSIIARLADLWGFTAVGDDAVELRFSREVDLKGLDRLTEYHRLDLPEAPPGDYEITLKLWDRLAERLVSRTRKFVILRRN